MLPPRDVTDEEREALSKDDLEGVALSFPDSGSNSGNTNTGNAARRCLLKDHLRERLVHAVPAEHQHDFRQVFKLFSRTKSVTIKPPWLGRCFYLDKMLPILVVLC